MPDALAATPAGLTLKEWQETRGIARSTLYRLLKAAQIEPEKVRPAGARAPVSVLTDQQVSLLDALVEKMRDGASVADLESALVATLAHATPSETISDTTPAAATPAGTLARLEAGERAIRSGLPVTTAEAGWLLLARPGGDEVRRGRVIARRIGRNAWSLELSETVSD
ncbi:MAG: hypothetical protein VKI42_08655 [Synechococcaceae cyanobacterium]|nr:hypothetical protein [Synechococcaceae cyanobacterium]